MPIQIKDGSELIARYKETGDKSIRNEIVLIYGNLIKYAAVSTRNMYQKYADTEDIVNEAALALMAAIDSFDFERNVKFETYASMKMRGAIIDYIRKQDLIPRNVRRFSKELDSAFSQLYTTLDREPTTDELAEFLKLPKDKLLKYMADSASATSLSFEELLYEGDFDISSTKDSDGVWDVEKDLYLKERNKLLARAIDDLKEQQRHVISLYYYERLKFSDIAKVLDVSESRVCQIHSKAMLKLKYNIEHYIKG